jgi:hypothetical protein
MKHLLKNNPEYFEKENLEILKKKFKFSQSRHIEMLIWDYEVLSQLLEYNPDFILKGGAATQVFLPENIQRASRDIDVATTLPSKEIEEILNKIQQKFSPHVEMKEHFSWAKRTIKDSKRKIEDLDVYIITIPTKIDVAPNKKGFSYLILDVIKYKKIPFKIKEIKNPIVFGLPIKPLKILSEGSLIADKLLTLGDKTTGIFAVRENDVDAFFKQVYDLSKLIDHFILKEEVLKDLFDTLEKLTPIEASYRNLDKSLLDILDDIEKSLEEKLEFDFKTDSKSIQLKDGLKSFRSEYLNKSEEVSLSTWISRLGKLKFIISLCIEKFKYNKSIAEIKEIIEKIFDIEKNIKSLEGDKLKKVRNILINHYSINTPYFKSLKNSIPERIFYNVINLKNIEKIKEEINNL